MLEADLSEREKARVLRLYTAKRKLGFPSADDFVRWYQNQLRAQNGSCFYCETPIVVIREIVDRAASDATIFHQLRKVGNSGVRGRSLEVERRDPNAEYSSVNCRLACYFCNNDKSYVYTEADYKEFFGSARKRHFAFLAKRLGIAMI